MMEYKPHEQSKREILPEIEAILRQNQVILEINHKILEGLAKPAWIVTDGDKV